MGDVAELGERQKKTNSIYTLWVFAIADHIKYFAEAIAGDKGTRDILSCILHAHISGMSKRKSKYFASNAIKHFYFEVEYVKIAVCLFREISGIDSRPTAEISPLIVQ